MNNEKFDEKSYQEQEEQLCQEVYEAFKNMMGIRRKLVQDNIIQFGELDQCRKDVIFLEKIIDQMHKKITNTINNWLMEQSVNTRMAAEAKAWHYQKRRKSLRRNH